MYMINMNINRRGSADFLYSSKSLKKQTVHVGIETKKIVDYRLHISSFY